MATGKMSIRLSEGFYHAVKDVAETLGTDLSETAGFLVMLGLSYIPETTYKVATKELIVADVLESYGGMMRTLAKMPKGQREKAIKNIENVLLHIRNLGAHMQKENH